VYRTTYSRLVLVLAGLFCLIGTLFVLWAFFVTRLYIQETNQKLNEDLAKHIAGHEPLLKHGQIREQAVQDLFHMLMAVNPNIELYLLDPEGTIRAYSAPPGKLRRNAVSLEPVRTFLSGRSTYPILGDDPRNPGRRKVFSAASLDRDGHPGGYLYIILAGEEYDSAAELLRASYILRLSLSVAGGTLLFALLAGIVIFRRITKPLRSFASAMEGFDSARLSEDRGPASPAGPGMGEEMARLAFVFRRMTDRVRSEVRRLRLADSSRRDLVADVSHDLQSPLASMRGYLETLLLKENLPPAERREYASRALDLCRYLSDLIAEMLELARLEAPGMRPAFEPFSFPDLAEDVALKFRMEAGKRGIAIDVDCPPAVPFVLGDIGLVERALTNLVDNALRFTSEQDRIILEAVPEGGRVTVRVRDTGPGILPEDLPRIFDRFRASRRKGKTGGGRTGLGLAITKRIAELHGAVLEVATAPSAGTAFSFSLPVAADGKGSGRRD
jgi:two-component system OmpR family sensor kinase